MGGRALILASMILLLTSCGEPEVRDHAPASPPDLAAIPDAVPHWEPRSRYGNPASYVVHGRRYRVLDNARGYRERGLASWYGSGFHGRRTSSGEPYDMYAMTAAHKTLPLPTYVRVTNLENGRQAIVRVNDRGPFHPGRIIDLSYAAATRLGMLGRGTARVEVEAIQPKAPGARPAPIPRATTRHAKDGRYLQVGAFASRFNAEALQRRLQRKLDQQVRVATLQRPNGPLYQVRIGPLGSAPVADLIQRLEAVGIHEYLVLGD